MNIDDLWKNEFKEREIADLNEKIDELIIERDQFKVEGSHRYDEIESLKEQLAQLKEEYSKISCGYCGKLCARTVEEITAHVENCDKHPVFKLINEKAELVAQLTDEKYICHEITRDRNDKLDEIESLKEQNKKMRECLVEIYNQECFEEDYIDRDLILKTGELLKQLKEGER
jgi:uncharacterized membrane protein